MSQRRISVVGGLVVIADSSWIDVNAVSLLCRARNASQEPAAQDGAGAEPMDINKQQSKEMQSAAGDSTSQQEPAGSTHVDGKTDVPDSAQLEAVPQADTEVGNPVGMDTGLATDDIGSAEDTAEPMQTETQ